MFQRCAECFQEAGQGEGGDVSRPEQAARVHDRAARQDDPGDSDPRPGEQQPQEEWSQQGGHQVCINNLTDLWRQMQACNLYQFLHLPLK